MSLLQEQSGCTGSGKASRGVTFTSCTGKPHRSARPWLLFATASRESATLTAFREDLEQHVEHASQIEEFCLDMWPAYLKGIRDSLPTASVTFDKFHVMKLLNETVDKVRRQEQRERPELKRSRYIWTTNGENLSPDQFALMDVLSTCLSYAPGLPGVLVH